MKNRYAIFFTLLAGTVILLFANVFVQKGIASIVKENKLVDESFVEEGTSPTVAFSMMALGGFRGVLADILWIRSNDLQQKGRYYELIQLSDWILKLQPKSAAAAAHMGWNLAYNVSVACKRPEDRWFWVRSGIQHMQKAVNLNPNDPNVYSELAWIYQHKLGNVLDDAQQYYKRTMAHELLAVYGAHYPDWQAWAESPATEKELRERFPDGSPAWIALLNCNRGDLDQLLKRFRQDRDLPEELKKALSPEDASVLVYYLRRRWLKEDWNIVPEKVLAINNEYGKLDWLLPESYAIYWAREGLDHTPGRKNMPLSRHILQSLVVSFHYGRMLLPRENEASDFFLLVPNTNVADSMDKLYKEILQSDEYSHVPFEALYENFLIDAVVTLYTYSQKELAAQFYRKLRTETKNPEARKLTLDQFAINELEDDLRTGDFKQTAAELDGLLLTSCLLLGVGDREGAKGHLDLAKHVYDFFLKEHSDIDRVKLPSFDEMKAETAKAVIANFPPEIANRVRAELQEDLLKQEQAEAEAAAAAAEQEASGQ